MTKQIYRQQTKPPRSALLMTGELIQPYQSASVNTKAAAGQPSTPFPALANSQNTMTNLDGNISSRTNSAKQGESPKIAAVLFRSTVLALLAAGMLKRGRDGKGNIVIVMPSTVWQDDIRLK